MKHKTLNEMTFFYDITTHVVYTMLLFPLIHCEEKSVVQTGQPTHFHMENRGPEIQVTADSEGVKINAKPAGLNVVAKPGVVPSTLPHSAIVSTMEDIPWTHAAGGPLHNILHAPITSPQLVHHDIEPVAYTAPISGFASFGDYRHYHDDVNTYDYPHMLHSSPFDGYGLSNFGYDGASFPVPFHHHGYYGYHHHHHPYHHHPYHHHHHHPEHIIFDHYYPYHYHHHVFDYHGGDFD